MASLVWLAAARLAVILPLCFWFVWSVSADVKTIPVWTWLDGRTLVNQPSTLTDGDQYPGCRAESGIWTPPTAGVVWMYGGRDGSGMALNDLWLYDMLSLQWTNLQRGKEQSWPRPRYGAAVCGVTNSSVVVFGGAQSTDNLLSDTWLYHLHNQSWTLLTDRSSPGERADLVHWCTYDALWIYGATNSDPNSPQTLWKLSFHRYDWTEVGADMDERGSFEELSDLVHRKTATWVMNNTQFYILGGNLSVTGESCKGKTCQVKNMSKCDLWRYSSLSHKWEHISMDTKANEGNQQARLAEQPSCLASAAFWPSSDGNLWLFDGSECDSTCEKAPQPRYNLWMLDQRLQRWISFQTHSPGTDVLEWSQDTHSQPPPRGYCANWSWNNTYYLFGGLTRNGSALNDLWDFQLMRVESRHQSPTHPLAVPPVAVFFLSLGALGILSLFVFAVIFFTKCSAGPRLKPPNHFGDKIRYSPVEMDEVLFT